MSQKIQGLAIHCHHDHLIEFCYDYDERVNYIIEKKPKNEQAIRLKLFKILPKKAIAELPIKIVKACAERDKAYAEWGKAYAEWGKACAEWGKAKQKIWHDKWCGCGEWNGTEIIFNEG